MRIQTAQGSVPIANFVTRISAPTTGTLTRLDGTRTVTVEAGIREGVQPDAVRAAVVAGLEAAELDKIGVRWKLAGEDACLVGIVPGVDIVEGERAGRCFAFGQGAAGSSAPWNVSSLPDGSNTW